MPSIHTLDDILGTTRAADEPQRHLNHDGAVIAITYTEAAWAAVDPALKTERNGQRSVVTRCHVRGSACVDAYVIPEFATAAPTPWSRAQRAGYACFAEAA